jgi:hypothetical protein
MAIKANVTFETRDVLKTDIALRCSSKLHNLQCQGLRFSAPTGSWPPQELGPLVAVVCCFSAYTCIVCLHHVDHTSDGKAFLEGLE